MKNVIVLIILVLGVAIFFWLRSDNVRRAEVQSSNNAASVRQVREVPQEQTPGYNETFKMSPSMYPDAALAN